MEPAADLDQEHERLLEFVYAFPHGMAELEADGTVAMLNPAFSCLLMPLLPPGGMFTNLLDVLDPWAPGLRALLRDFAPARGLICDGLRVQLGPEADAADPRVLALTILRLTPDRQMAVLSDISGQVAQERRLRESEAWFAALLHAADDYAMLGVDAQGRVDAWNGSGERVFGHRAAKVLGQPAAGLVTPARTSAGGDKAALAARLAVARNDGWHLDEGWRARADGSRFWGTCMVSPLEPDPEARDPETMFRYVMVVRDTTRQRRSTDDLRRALTADHLTGALNRRTFFERAGHAVRRSRRDGHPLSVIMIDVDHFKAVNDRHGHAGGDVALRAIAEALQAELRDLDLLGRIGGEEFAVLLPTADQADAVRAAERLRARIAALAIEHEGVAIPLTVSLGVAALGQDAPNLERLLAAADQAMYRAKRAGRDRVCVAAGARMLADAATAGA